METAGAARLHPTSDSVTATVHQPPNPFVKRSIVAERLDRKQKLAAAFRLFAHFGFDEGAAGYMSVRDPERTDCFWANPFAMSFRQVRASDLLLVAPDGEVLHGTWPVSRSIVNIHGLIHGSRPDAVCIVHAHTMYSKAFSALHLPLSPITQDACIFFEDHGVLWTVDGARVANKEEVSKSIVAALGDYKAAIIGNHGIYTVGQTVEEAVFWYISLEHSCQAELLARAAGELQLVPDEYAREIRAQIGAPISGWYSGRPWFDWIMADQPDCLT